MLKIGMMILNVDQVKEKLLKILAMIVHVDRANMIDIVEDSKDDS